METHVQCTCTNNGDENMKDNTLPNLRDHIISVMRTTLKRKTIKPGIYLLKANFLDEFTNIRLSGQRENLLRLSYMMNDIPYRSLTP